MTSVYFHSFLAGIKVPLFRVIALFSGIYCGTVYLFYRTETTLFSYILGRNSGDSMPIELRNVWQEALVYSIPGALWVGISTFTLSFFLYDFSWGRRLVFAPLLFVCVQEILQYTEITYGTGDWQDILWASMACCISLFFAHIRKRYSVSNSCISKWRSIACCTLVFVLVFLAHPMR